jgi:hypothetical protein
MHENLFKKNNYFCKELFLSKVTLKEKQARIKNWQNNCESFNPDVDKEKQPMKTNSLIFYSKRF